MRALVINCCPVRNGATAYIAETVTGELAARIPPRRDEIVRFVRENIP